MSLQAPLIHPADGGEQFNFLNTRTSVLVGGCAGQEQVLEVGGTVWLPKGLPHQFQAVAEGPTRFLQLTTPAQFERFVEKLGTPKADATLPEPAEIDPDEVARICAEFQIEVLGPPPPPLD